MEDVNNSCRIRKWNTFSAQSKGKCRRGGGDQVADVAKAQEALGGEVQLEAKAG